MTRNRGKDEWFPIGEVSSGQNRPEQELLEDSPQAAYHFTHLDQVDQKRGSPHSPPFLTVESDLNWGKSPGAVRILSLC